MALIPCIKCGSSISEKATECPHCKAARHATTANDRSRKNTKLLITLAGTAATITAGVIIAIYLATSNNMSDIQTNQLSQLNSDAEYSEKSIEKRIEDYYENLNARNYSEVEQTYAELLDRFYLKKNINKNIAMQEMMNYDNKNPNNRFTITNINPLNESSCEVTGTACTNAYDCKSTRVVFKFNANKKINYIRAYSIRDDDTHIPMPPVDSIAVDTASIDTL